MNVKAIYENSIFKPLSPIGLSEHQLVELQIEPILSTPHIAKLGGAWRNPSGDLSYEDIEATLHESHEEALQRLLDQVDGSLNGG